MLAIKKLAGVALEVNLRTRLHTGDGTSKQGINPGVSGVTVEWVAPQNGIISSTYLKKTVDVIQDITYNITGLLLSLYSIHFVKKMCFFDASIFV